MIGGRQIEEGMGQAAHSSREHRWWTFGYPTFFLICALLCLLVGVSLVVLGFTAMYPGWSFAYVWAEWVATGSLTFVHMHFGYTGEIANCVLGPFWLSLAVAVVGAAVGGLTWWSRARRTEWPATVFLLALAVGLTVLLAW